MSNKNLKHFKQLWYMPILAIAMAIMLGRLLIVARLLSLEEFATFSLGLLISTTFCMLGCLGLQSLLQRDLPVMIVRRREKAGAVLAMQCILVASGTALALIILSMVFSTTLLGISVKLGVIGLIHGLSQQLFTLATVDSRSRSQPIVYANQNLVRAILLALISPMAISLGADPLSALAFEASVTLALSTFLVGWNLSSINVSPIDAMAVGFRRLGRIRWNTAVVLLLINALAFIANSLDRWIAAQQLTNQSFGIYSFAWTVCSAAQAAQLIINAAVYPLLARRYALNGSALAFKLCARLSNALLLISLTMGAMFFPIIEFLVTEFFERYASSLLIIQVFIVCACFRVSNFWASYAIVAGRESHLLKATIVSVASVFITWILLVSIISNQIDLLSIAYLALMLTIGAYASAIFVARAGMNEPTGKSKCAGS